jgi:hypothetical protein
MPAPDEEIQASALQFVRQLNGFNKPSRAIWRAVAIPPHVTSGKVNP